MNRTYRENDGALPGWVGLGRRTQECRCKLRSPGPGREVDRGRHDLCGYAAIPTFTIMVGFTRTDIQTTILAHTNGRPAYVPAFCLRSCDLVLRRMLPVVAFAPLESNEFYTITNQEARRTP